MCDSHALFIIKSASNTQDKTTHYLVLLNFFNFLYQQRPVLMMRTATVNQKWLLMLFRYGHHCKVYLYANLAKQVKPLIRSTLGGFPFVRTGLPGHYLTSQLANEIGFFQRAFPEKPSPLCILFRI